MHRINKSMLWVNSPWPFTCQFIFERFRFTYASVRMFQYICEQFLNAFGHVGIILLLIWPLFLGNRSKYQFHSSSKFTSIPLPAFRSSSPLRISFMVCSENMIYSVSFKELYSSKEIITTPVPLPRLISTVSQSSMPSIPHGMIPRYIPSNSWKQAWKPPA